MRCTRTTRASRARSRSSTSGPTPLRSCATGRASSGSTTGRSSRAATTGGPPGASSSSRSAVADARELADLISSDAVVPASGWVAGVSASLAAALVAKAAARSEGWSGAGGAGAQAADLRDRLLELATRDAEAYEAALTALERRDPGLARVLAEAADV